MGELPGTAVSCQELLALPGTAGSCRELPGTAGSCWELLGTVAAADVAGGCQKLPVGGPVAATGVGAWDGHGVRAEQGQQLRPGRGCGCGYGYGYGHGCGSGYARGGGCGCDYGCGCGFACGCGRRVAVLVTGL